MKHFHKVLLRRNILSQYTLRYRYVTGSGLRPETRQKPDAPAACPTPADRERFSRPSRRYQETGLSEKRNKMLTMWVTEDEHRRLLERCDGRQLAAWMRQTCLDEKPARTGKLPSISPALLRQLAGMGNNLNQIARRVNAGGGTGHDRVQIVAALMTIDAGLERLRHAVLEKGTDDDR